MQLPASILPALARCLESITDPTDTHKPASASNAVLALLVDIVRLADAALFCENWLRLAGSAVFSETRDGVRGMLKGPLTRILVSVVMSAAHTQGMPNHKERISTRSVCSTHNSLQIRSAVSLYPAACEDTLLMMS